MDNQNIYTNQDAYSNNQSGQELEVPVSMGEWLVSCLLMLIPCVNVVLLFVWAFSKKEKKSKSNFFKVALILSAIGFVLGVILSAIIGASAYTIFSSMYY